LERKRRHAFQLLYQITHTHTHTHTHTQRHIWRWFITCEIALFYSAVTVFDNCLWKLWSWRRESRCSERNLKLIQKNQTNCRAYSDPGQLSSQLENHIAEKVFWKSYTCHSLVFQCNYPSTQLCFIFMCFTHVMLLLEFASDLNYLFLWIIKYAICIEYRNLKELDMKTFNSLRRRKGRGKRKIQISSTKSWWVYSDPDVFLTVYKKKELLWKLYRCVMINLHCVVATFLICASLWFSFWNVHHISIKPP